MSSDDEALARRVRPLFADCAASDARDPQQVELLASGSRPIELRIGGVTVLDDVSVELAIADLVWQVNQRAARPQVDRVLVHAAAVDVDGIGVLLPGSHGAGKSTLASGLVRAGARYLTDDVAAIDPVSGWITPYPKPISLKLGSWSRFADVATRADDDVVATHEEWLVPPAAVRRGTVVSGGCPARVVVFPQYRSGAPARVSALSGAEAALHLVSSTFGFAERPRIGLDRAASIARRCRAVRLEIGDLDEAIEQVLTLVSEAGEAFDERPDDRPDRAPTRSDATGESARRLRGVVRRREGAQWVAIDGELVVYDVAAASVHHLNSSSAVVWQACDGRASVDEIVEVVASAFELDDRAASAGVARALAALEGAGLVIVSEAT